MRDDGGLRDLPSLRLLEGLVFETTLTCFDSASNGSSLRLLLDA